MTAAQEKCAELGDLIEDEGVEDAISRRQLLRRSVAGAAIAAPVVGLAIRDALPHAAIERLRSIRREIADAWKLLRVAHARLSAALGGEPPTIEDFDRAYEHAIQLWGDARGRLHTLEQERDALVETISGG